MRAPMFTEPGWTIAFGAGSSPLRIGFRPGTVGLGDGVTWVMTIGGATVGLPTGAATVGGTSTPKAAEAPPRPGWAPSRGRSTGRLAQPSSRRHPNRAGQAARAPGE